MKQIKVIDYEAGNLFNVARAFEYLGCQTEYVMAPDQLKGGDFLVLPGVGAFGDGMSSLHQRGLVEPILEWVNSGKPFFGICLGMQLMLTSSEEFGHHEGLGIVPGHVRKLPAQPGLKIPNIGWYALQNPKTEDQLWDKGFLQDLSLQQDMYFVHSFSSYPEDPENWLAVSEFGNHLFCSVVSRDNIFGCQFHPEKSGEAGLQILRRFLDQ